MKVCFENQQLAFQCQQLKNSKDSFNLFWKNAVKIKIVPNSEIHQILYTTDIEKLLGENLEYF